MKFPTMKNDNQTNRKEEKSSEKSETQQKDALCDEKQVMEEAIFPHYKRVSDYLLGSCIGEGAFAKVRVGLHYPTKEKVAIKIINKERAKRDNYVYKNLHREGKILQMLRHPNIVQIYDILETENNYYLVAELCSGGELIDIVGAQGSLSEDVVRKYMFQLINAVAYMHERKIVHRDLKVENLLLDSQDNLKIIDFGLSNALPDPCSDTSRALVTQCGSPAYAAPELLSKKTYGPKVDVWSIGIITFALLVGKLPFTVEPLHIPKLCKKMMRRDMRPIPSHISFQCREFIERLLCPEQEHRPTVYQGMQMTWISTFLDVDQNPSKGSFPPLFIDHLPGEVGFCRHISRLTRNTTPPIDSSIVKEMSASYEFSCSDVVHCVHKNRPGSALATYYLLRLKRKQMNNSQGARSERFTVITAGRLSSNHSESRLKQVASNALNEHSMSQSSHSEPTSTTDGSDSEKLSDGRVLTTCPLPNIKTPEQPLKAVFRNKKISQHCNKEQTGISSKNEVHSISTKRLDEKKEELTHNTNHAMDYRSVSPIYNFSSQHNETANEKTSPSSKIEKNKERNTIFEIERSTQFQPTKGIPPTNKSAKVSEKLINSKEIRAIPKGEKMELNRTGGSAKPGNVFQRDIKGVVFHERKPQEKSSKIYPSSSPRKSVRLVSLNTISIHPPRSIPHQGQKEDLLNHHARHCSRDVLPQLSDCVSPEHTQVRASPFKQRPIHSRLNTIQNLEETVRHKSPSLRPGRKFSETPKLPLLVTKSIPESRSQGDQAVYHSLQTTKSFRHLQRLAPASCHGNKVDSVNNERKHLETKLSVPLKLPKRETFKTTHALSELNHDDSHRHNSSSKKMRPPNRPRKVISEPIAAAISYLTSTKKRVFRKEKEAALPSS